ncbi:MAG: FAD-binding protein, partial [Planctomycetales bacterium]|nr:FAD-binding protein [Planctomycetales bacterium]
MTSIITHEQAFWQRHRAASFEQSTKSGQLAARLPRIAYNGRAGSNRFSDSPLSCHPILFILVSRVAMENSPSRFVSDLRQLVREDARPILPCGSTTKSALSRSQAGCLRIDMRPLAGIVAYDPSEFLITARAGTPVGDLMTSLARHGQYLPFDPLFVEAGATVGGTIASGISGPNRLLYGSLRDFVMEVELIDGLGKLVRGGGKVVKNAAGFDIPKMMVGSYGRMGVLTEVTLKVFPAPQALAVMSTQCESLSEAVNVLQQVMAKPFPVNAIHLCPEHRLVLQLAGPDASLGQVQQRVQSVVPHAWVAGDMAEAEQEARRLQAWLEQAPSEQIDGAPSGGEQRA